MTINSQTQQRCSVRRRGQKAAAAKKGGAGGILDFMAPVESDLIGHQARSEGLAAKKRDNSKAGTAAGLQFHSTAPPALSFQSSLSRASSQGVRNPCITRTVFKISGLHAEATTDTGEAGKSDSAHAQNRAHRGAKEVSEVPRHRDVWAEAFRPRTESDLAVHPAKVGEFKQWLSRARQQLLAGAPHVHRMMVLRGPSGAGKTAMVRTLAQDLSFEVVEWSCGGGVSYQRSRDLAIGHASELDELRRFLRTAQNFTPLAMSEVLHRE
jgi:hypothetical protein